MYICSIATVLTLDCFTLSLGGNWTVSFFGCGATGGKTPLIPPD